LLIDFIQCCNVANSVVPFFPFQVLFVGATNLELQQRLLQYLHVLFTQPSSHTFRLMALSVYPVNPVNKLNKMVCQSNRLLGTPWPATTICGHHINVKNNDNTNKINLSCCSLHYLASSSYGQLLNLAVIEEIARA